MSNNSEATALPSWYNTARLASGTPVAALLLVLDLFLFVFLLLCRNSPVIKSRGVVTYLALLVHVICGVITIINSNDIPSEAACFGVLIIVYPFYTCLLCMYFLQYVRFVLLRQSQQMKQDFAEKKPTSAIMLKTIAVLSSPWIVIPCIAVIGFGWNIVLWILVLTLKDGKTGVLGVYSRTKCNNAFLFMTSIFTSSLLVIGIAVIIVFLLATIPLARKSSLKKVLHINIANSN